MGVRILYDADSDQAALYCSTSDWAFGPVVCKGDDGRDAQARMKAFLRWTDTDECAWMTYEQHPVPAAFLADGARRDPRQLTDSGLSSAYGDWLAQEAAQYAAEQAAALDEV